MRWKVPLIPVLALFFAIAAIPAASQVAPAADQGRWPIAVGGGISDYSLDWGASRRMMGITAWADWNFLKLPSVFSGLGIEVEGRDINFNRPSSLSRMRQDTILGGALYTWRRYRRFQPYGKYLLGFGSIDFPPFPNIPNYSHDTRTVYAPGAGVNYCVWHKVSVRADYEYQFWHAIFGSNDLNPNGITIGAIYDFGAPGK